MDNFKENVGAHCWLRWQHVDSGIISAAVYVSLLKETKYGCVTAAFRTDASLLSYYNYILNKSFHRVQLNQKVLSCHYIGTQYIN